MNPKRIGGFFDQVMMLGDIVSLILKLVLAAVLLTFVLRLYEWRNLPRAEQGETEERLAPWLAGTVAMVWEFLCSLFVVALLPVGWLQSDTRDPVTTDDRPLIVVSGLVANSGALHFIRRFFNKLGHGAVYTVDLGPVRAGIEHFADLIADKVEEVLALTGKTQADLICFGVGGLAARLYVTAGGAPRVANLIFVGVPHQGTRLGVFLPNRTGDELLPGHPLLTRLGSGLEQELRAGPRYANIYSTFDNLVLPPTAATLAGVESQRLDYLGHSALYFSSQVNSICAKIIDGYPPASGEEAYFTEFPNG